MRAASPLLAVPVAALLIGAFYLHISRDLLSSTSLTHPHPLRHRHSLSVRREHLPSSPRRPSPPTTTSVLLPDWQVLLLLPPNTPPPPTRNNNNNNNNNNNHSCLFHTSHTSPARPISPLSFLCSLPSPLRRLRPFQTPLLISSSSSPPPPPTPTPTEMIRWKRLVYSSLSTPHDLILFAKGVNPRQAVNRLPDSLRCLFLPSGTTTPVTSSAQEVFRCPHPPTSQTTVTLELRQHDSSWITIPTVATYNGTLSSDNNNYHSLLCACTMVYNSAKFLPEWVVYHSGIGVDRFILYDNGSDDDLELVIGRLNSAGHNVSARPWPWPKTQEAGFSHCAAAEAAACTWMAFLDVDEFVYSPGWVNKTRPDRSMMRSLLPDVSTRTGQVTLGCRDFGPSGRRRHPAAGVTQGYTCRRRAEERHKAVVRLEAVAGGSLVNSVHHFGGMGDGWRTRRRSAATVNHYKYQAWEEFRQKFRRRVSAYVADWREEAGMGSRDRAPGLGREPVEPLGWADGFCEVNDTGLRDTARRWFGSVGGGGGEYRMTWQE